jgi:hypothetical protein
VTPSLFNDELLRQLIAVGQVDVVVGIPTFNHATTIAAVVQTAEEGLARSFPRERTVIMSADGGSTDGTPDIVRALAVESGRGRGMERLRTRHVISGVYSGLPSRPSALQLIFAAADLLQARGVAVLDPEVTSLQPSWIGALATPVIRQSLDLVSPLYDRHPLEAPLLSQLVRPLLRATLSRDVQEPLLGEFACSGRFAAACLSRHTSAAGFSRPGVEVWLMVLALAGNFTLAQAFLGPRALAPPTSARPGLTTIFPSYIGTLFSGLSEHSSAWLKRTGSERVPIVGPVGFRTAAPPAMDPAAIGESFRRDVEALHSILETILSPETLARLQGLIEPGREATYDDDLWVATAYDFLSAHHAGVMDRAHVTQALMPLYLGRLASFVARRLAMDADAVEQDLERLAVEFEQRKPYLIERWNRSTTR